MSEKLQTRKFNKSIESPSSSNQSKLLNKNEKPLMLHPPLFQAKLAISQPEDKYEQEADRIAEEVVRKPKSSFLQRKCTKCNKDEKKILNTKKFSRRKPATQSKDVHPIVEEVLRSPGYPLDKEVRAFMEPRFGYDFSQVRIHKDVKAVDSARAVNALAYTVDNHIIFDTDFWAPATSAGRELLAHELVHTIQQTPLLQFSSLQSLHNSNSMKIGPMEDIPAAKSQLVSSDALNVPVTFPIHSSSCTSPLIQRRTGSRDYTDVAYYDDDDKVRDWVKGHVTELKNLDISVKIHTINTLLSGWISNEDVKTLGIICKNIYTAADVAMTKKTLEAELHIMTDIGQRTQIRFIISEMSNSKELSTPKETPEKNPTDKPHFNVHLCDRYFSGKKGPYFPARHCFVSLTAFGEELQLGNIKQENTLTYDNKVSGVPDSEPNKPGTVCRGHYPINTDCVKQKYKKLCNSANYDISAFNCCSCAYLALTACGAKVSRSDFPPKNQGTGLPDSFGRGWKKKALELLTTNDNNIRDWVKGHVVELKNVDISFKIHMINVLLSGWISNEDINTVDVICKSIDVASDVSMTRETLKAKLSAMIDIGQRSRIRVIISQME